MPLFRPKRLKNHTLFFFLGGGGGHLPYSWHRVVPCPPALVLMTKLMLWSQLPFKLFHSRWKSSCRRGKIPWSCYEDFIWQLHSNFITTLIQHISQLHRIQFKCSKPASWHVHGNFITASIGHNQSTSLSIFNIAPYNQLHSIWST